VLSAPIDVGAAELNARNRPVLCFRRKSRAAWRERKAATETGGLLEDFEFRKRQTLRLGNHECICCAKLGPVFWLQRISVVARSNEALLGIKFLSG
jgi:hypothetical protein